MKLLPTLMATSLLLLSGCAANTTDSRAEYTKAIAKGEAIQPVAPPPVVTDASNKNNWARDIEILQPAIVGCTGATGRDNTVVEYASLEAKEKAKIFVRTSNGTATICRADIKTGRVEKLTKVKKHKVPTNAPLFIPIGTKNPMQCSSAGAEAVTMNGRAIGILLHPANGC